MRILGKGDEQASEAMNDILAQVSWNLADLDSFVDILGLGCNEYGWLKECWKFDSLRDGSDSSRN